MLERASETGVIPPDELAMLRVAMGESAYQLQMECNPNAALAHAIYGTWMEEARAANRVCRLPWETSVQVDWFADIGHSMRGDDWAWWAVQMKGRDILLQRYFSNTNKAPCWYASDSAPLDGGGRLPDGLRVPCRTTARTRTATARRRRTT